MISIIIPHYNTPELLVNLLNSIEFELDTEVIVIDDKSNQFLDELESVIKSEKYSHVIFLKNESVIKSAGTSRNIGLKIAKGEWILFADADDKFVDGYSKKIEKYLRTDAEVIYFTPTSYDIKLKEKSHRHIVAKKLIERYLNQDDEESELFLRYKFPEPWSKLIRNDFIRKYNLEFDETIAANDRMFSTKVGYYASNLLATKDEIYQISFLKGSLTNNISKNVFEARMNVFINYYHFLEEHLSKHQFTHLNISGRKFIYKSVVYNFGLKYTFKVLLKLIENKIKFFSWELFNPIRVMKYFLRYLKFIKESEYYISED